MNGPHFEYLTNAYVEALGLEKFPFERPAPTIACFFGEDMKPTPVALRGFDICVVYNHGLYAREPDGLAWSRLDR